MTDHLSELSDKFSDAAEFSRLRNAARHRDRHPAGRASGRPAGSRHARRQDGQRSRHASSTSVARKPPRDSISPPSPRSIPGSPLTPSCSSPAIRSASSRSCTARERPSSTPTSRPPRSPQSPWWEGVERAVVRFGINGTTAVTQDWTFERDPSVDTSADDEDHEVADGGWMVAHRGWRLTGIAAAA